MRVFVYIYIYIYTYVHILSHVYLLPWMCVGGCIFISSLFWAEKNLKNCFNPPLLQKKGIKSKALGNLFQIPELGFRPNKTPGIWSLGVPLEDPEDVFWQDDHVYLSLSRHHILTPKRDPHLKPFSACPRSHLPSQHLCPHCALCIFVSPTVLSNGSCSVNVCKWMNGWVGHE